MQIASRYIAIAVSRTVDIFPLGVFRSADLPVFPRSRLYRSKSLFCLPQILAPLPAFVCDCSRINPARLPIYTLSPPLRRLAQDISHSLFRRILPRCFFMYSSLSSVLLPFPLCFSPTLFPAPFCGVYSYEVSFLSSRPSLVSFSFRSLPLSPLRRPFLPFRPGDISTSCHGCPYPGADGQISPALS